MHLKLRRLNCLLWAVLAIISSGCSREEPAEIVIINGAEPESLDPAIISGQPDMRVAMSLFEGLTRFNARTGEPEPGLASQWDISEDGLTYTFHLRPDSKWSNGDLITADDVVWSWLRVLDPNTAADYVGVMFYLKNAEALHYGRITDPSLVGVRALDEHTVHVELESPTAFFLSLCAFTTFAIVPRDVIQEHGDRWVRGDGLITNGPYTLEFWRINDRIRIRRNPNYWDNANTQNELVDILPISAANTALNLYLTGEADIVWDKSLVPVHLTDVLRSRPDFHSFDYLGSYFARFNTTKPPFDDVRVRKAFAMTINRDRIVNRITRAGEKPAETIVPVSAANYLPADGLEYDPEEARRLMAEAGYPEGEGFPEASYLFNASTSAGLDEKVAVELQAMWRDALGVNVSLRQMEWKTYLAGMSALDYDICRSSWIADYNDPNTFLDMFLTGGGNNRTGWSSEQYDQWISEANSMTDLEERARVFQKAETFLLQEGAPIATIYSYSGFNYYDPEKIKGIYANPIDQHPINAIRKVKE